MSESFDFLFGEYREHAARLLDGIVIEQTAFVFNDKVMDAPFAFNQKIVEGLREHLESKGIQVKRIVVFNALITNLERGEGQSMRSKSALYVVKNINGENNAVYFSGCAIGEFANGSELPQ